MVAVLKHNSGIFMDADTLILNTLQPVIHLLKQTDIILFNTHLGFMAANSGSVILNDWLERIKKDLRELSTPINTTKNFSWDYIGNRNLANIMIEMVHDHDASGISRLTVLNLLNAIIDRLNKINLINRTKLSGNFTRIQTAIKYRKIDFAFNGDLKKYLWMLDRISYGFIAEAAYYGSKIKDPQAQYEQFWFNNDRELDVVFSNSKTIIGLHNSWTPGWYKKLNEHEVFEDKSLLSRTIKHILKN